MEVWATLSDTSAAAADLLLVRLIKSLNGGMEEPRLHCLFTSIITQLCRRRLKRLLTTSTKKGQAGTELLARLPSRITSWIYDTPDVDGSGGESEVCTSPVAATCNLMRLAAELIRTSACGSIEEAEIAMACIESLQG